MIKNLVVKPKALRMEVEVKALEGDLSHVTARNAAEMHLKDKELLGGYGGDWYYDGMERRNYNHVVVWFTQ